ncbi:hypothetical protein K461DRAFT_53239 [Myriangium duriaei CBS 260.36]|uniref:Uncharacterized protein n=1 Tax=Myriangium duriaei CBS 260.36 TaxID=1168546 RepID=A0A9P4IY02_9PEZI|nr:hypothetical protein K461DRAFT_53239 [Myriangium duriaei CBS 260.36]
MPPRRSEKVANPSQRSHQPHQNSDHAVDKIPINMPLSSNRDPIMIKPRALSVYLRRSLRHFRSKSLAAFNLTVHWRILGAGNLTSSELHNSKAERKLSFDYGPGDSKWMGTVVFCTDNNGLADPCAIYSLTENDSGRQESLSSLFTRFLAATKPQWEQKNLADSQLAWWLMNGKSFRLLDLPPELRDTIYDRASGSVIEPYSKDTISSTGRSYKRLPNLSLLLANKQIYHEITGVMASKAVFCFTSAWNFVKFMRKRAVWLLDIKHIELDLDHAEYLRLLDGSHGAFDKLRKMRPDQLVVRLARLDQTNSGPLRVMFIEGCHWRVTNWILCRLWENVAGQKVLLTGGIQPQAKEQMELQFEKAHAELHRMDKLRQSLGLGPCDWDDFWDNEVAGGVRIGTPGMKSSAPFPVVLGTWQPTAPVACQCPQSCDNVDWEPMRSELTTKHKKLSGWSG